MQLDCGPVEKVKVYWLLPGKNLCDGLRIIESDDDTLVMKQVVGRVNDFVVYIDQYNQIGDSISWNDVVLNPLTELPNVESLVKLSEFYSNLPSKEQDQGATSPGNADISSVDTEDSDYANSDYDFQDGDDDLFVDNVDEEVVDVGSARGKKA